MHKWYVEGLEYEVLSIHQDKPHTMVHLKHVGNGVTYEARGWTRWDRTGEWSNGDGVEIAMKRARRKIEARLKWETGLKAENERLTRQWLNILDKDVILADTRSGISDLHRDGGTVWL